MCRFELCMEYIAGAEVSRIAFLFLYYIAREVNDEVSKGRRDFVKF